MIIGPDGTGASNGIVLSLVHLVLDERRAALACLRFCALFQLSLRLDELLVLGRCVGLQEPLPWEEAVTSPRAFLD